MQVGWETHLPTDAILDYEPLSIMDWTLHYSILGFNVGIIQRLFKTDINSSASGTKKKRVYAVAVAGFGQEFFGAISMLSHSLVGRNFIAEQALHNLAHSCLVFSVMSIGPLLLLPMAWGILCSLMVGISVMKGAIYFGNGPGILLANLGLLAVLFAPEKDFPTEFKVGYGMLSTALLVVYLVDKYFIYSGTDIGHMLTASWILITTVFQRWSLLKKECLREGSM